MLDLRSMQNSWRKSPNAVIEKPVQPAPMTEKERKASRKAIKDRLAELMVLDRDWRTAHDALVAIEGQLDEIAAKHVEDCEPLQAELRQLEEARVQETIDRKPSNEKREARRLVLIETLQQMNNALADALERTKKRIPPLQQELKDLQQRKEGKTIESEQRKLLQLGTREAMDALFVAEQRLAAACNWAVGVRRNVSKVIDPEASRLWQLVDEAAGSDREAAQREIERIRQQIINE